MGCEGDDSVDAVDEASPGRVRGDIAIHRNAKEQLVPQARVEGVMAVSSNGQWPGYDVSLHRI